MHLFSFRGHHLFFETRRPEKEKKGGGKKNDSRFRRITPAARKEERSSWGGPCRILPEQKGRPKDSGSAESPTQGKKKTEPGRLPRPGQDSPAQKGKKPRPRSRLQGGPAPQLSRRKGGRRRSLFRSCFFSERKKKGGEKEKRGRAAVASVCKQQIKMGRERKEDHVLSR